MTDPVEPPGQPGPTGGRNRRRSRSGPRSTSRSPSGAALRRLSAGAITELVSFVMFLSSAKRQSLHDLIGGTVVMRDPNKVLG